jgi:hypothetical protein
MPWYQQSGAFQRRAPSTTSFDGPVLAVTANCRCSRRAKARPFGPKPLESGECRITPASLALRVHINAGKGSQR